MKLRSTIAIAVSSLMLVALPNKAHADSAKPGQSMTHMKTAAGVASTLEAAGVILYVQGGATLEEYTPFEVEGLGIQCAYRRYYDAALGEHYAAFTAMYGVGIAKVGQIAALKNAA